MASYKPLLVIGVLLLASLLAEGDAQQNDQKASNVKPQTHEGGWGGWGGGGGGWGRGGGGGWGGGGKGGGWGGGGWGGGGHGGGWGGGGWGGGGHGGGWGGGGGCGYRCGGRCCTPQEIARIEKIEGMNTEVKPDGYGYGGGGRWGGGGGRWGGGCRYYCGYRCCGSPEEYANFQRLVMTNDVKPESEISPQGHGGGGWGGGGGGWGGGGHGGGCRYRCGNRCCSPQEVAAAESEAKEKETKNEKKGEVNN